MYKVKSFLQCKRPRLSYALSKFFFLVEKVVKSKIEVQVHLVYLSDAWLLSLKDPNIKKFVQFIGISNKLGCLEKKNIEFIWQTSKSETSLTIKLHFAKSTLCHKACELVLFYSVFECLIFVCFCFVNFSVKCIGKIRNVAWFSKILFTCTYNFTF